VDVEFSTPPAPEMLPLRVSPGPLPFRDGAAEVVMSVDALEHVPPAERTPFLEELVRVAAHRVVMVCPTREAAAIDQLVELVLASTGQPIPPWLREHDEHGLPDRAEVIRACRAVDADVEVREIEVGNGFLAGLVALGDTLPWLAPQAAGEYAADRDGWRRLFEQASFGPPVRVGIEIVRNRPLSPSLDGAAPWARLHEALRCTACGGDTVGADLACADCGARPERDGSVIDLTGKEREWAPA
jgi:hypothetical protein